MAESEERTPVALITGSSRGIGLAIAEEFARHGYAVALNHSGEASREAAQAQAARLAGEYGVQSCAIQADVSSFDQAKALVKQCKDELGGIDVLVNNAGITKDGLLARMGEADFDRVVEVNMKGVFNCMRHACMAMMRQRSGAIVNVSSIVGVRGNAGQVNYAASKAGIIGITKAAAKELAPRNITVNAVAPGFIETDMTAGLIEEDGTRRIGDLIGLGRLGSPADVAAAVYFLASPQASYITGQVLAVDGGVVL